MLILNGRLDTIRHFEKMNSTALKVIIRAPWNIPESVNEIVVENNPVKNRNKIKNVSHLPTWKSTCCDDDGDVTDDDVTSDDVTSDEEEDGDTEAGSVARVRRGTTYSVEGTTSAATFIVAWSSRRHTITFSNKPTTPAGYWNTNTMRL